MNKNQSTTSVVIFSPRPPRGKEVAKCYHLRQLLIPGLDWGEANLYSIIVLKIYCFS